MALAEQNALSDVQPDRRSSKRTLVELPVYLVIAGVRFEQCLMKDVSDRGAKILVPHGTWIPNRFCIICPNGEFELYAEKVWVRYGNIGVRFMTEEERRSEGSPYING